MRSVLLGLASVIQIISELGLLQLVNVVTEFQGRSQLQAQVLHDHVTFQQQKSIAIDLLVEQDQKRPRK